MYKCVHTVTNYTSGIARQAGRSGWEVAVQEVCGVATASNTDDWSGSMSITKIGTGQCLCPWKGRFRHDILAYDHNTLCWSVCTCSRVAKLAAHSLGIVGTPTNVTNRCPQVVDTHLNPSLPWLSASNQPNLSMGTFVRNNNVTYK